MSCTLDIKGYKYSWYKYIEERFRHKDYYTWKNYNDYNIWSKVPKYEQTKVGNFKWTPKHDDDL